MARRKLTKKQKITAGVSAVVIAGLVTGTVLLVRHRKKKASVDGLVGTVFPVPPPTLDALQRAKFHLCRMPKDLTASDQTVLMQAVFIPLYEHYKSQAGRAPYPQELAPLYEKMATDALNGCQGLGGVPPMTAALSRAAAEKLARGAWLVQEDVA